MTQIFLKLLYLLVGNQSVVALSFWIENCKGFQLKLLQGFPALLVILHERASDSECSPTRRSVHGSELSLGHLLLAPDAMQLCKPTWRGWFLGMGFCRYRGQERFGRIRGDRVCCCWDHSAWHVVCAVLERNQIRRWWGLPLAFRVGNKACVSSEWHFLGRCQCGRITSLSFARFGHWTWRGDLSKLVVAVGDDRGALCVSPVSVAFFFPPLICLSGGDGDGDGEVHVSGQAARRRVLLATAIRTRSGHGHGQRQRLSSLLK